MQNIDLDLFLNKIHSNVSYKICSSDELNFLLRDNEFVIVNTDPSSLPGHHWVVFYRNKEGIIQFFDSFGHKPDFYTFNFVKFLQRNVFESYYIFNPCTIQSNTSNICGLYCLFFYVYICNDFSFNEFLCQFTNNTTLNDLYCLKSIEKLFDYTFILNKI